jgi:hypothetical protein
MEYSNNEIFKTKVFYEFFLYCMKSKLKFNMDVLNETYFNFDEETKTVDIIIPKEHDKYEESKILSGWKDVIQKIESKDKKIEMLNFLKNLVE